MENSGKKVEPAVKVYDTGNTDSIRGRRYGTVASQVEREKTVESFQESSSQKNEPFFATDTHGQNQTKSSGLGFRPPLSVCVRGYKTNRLISAFGYVKFTSNPILHPVAFR
jgi:hypothetical protein